MVKEIITDAQLLKNSINYLLPASEIVCREVQEAYRIAEKYLAGIKRKFHIDDNTYLHSLRVALRVAQWCKENCDSDSFFPYRPIIVALLHDVIEDADSPELRKDLEVFKSIDNYIINNILTLTNSEGDIVKYGKSKYMVMKFSTLMRTSNELFMIKLADRLDNLKSLSTIEDTKEYVINKKEAKLWKKKYLLETYAVYLNTINSSQVINQTVFPVFNELAILLNEQKF